jgi:hypothetical protein
LEARLAPTVSFATQKTFSVGSLPTTVATADFNGDGKPDLVIGTQGNESVAVLLDTTAAGAAAPSFGPVQTFAVGNSPDALTVADFNGDGKPDLAAVNVVDQTVSVLLNTTPAGASTVSFAPQQIFLIGFDANAVVAADLNGDGKPDLIVANANNNNPGTLSVLLNMTAIGSATSSFAPQQTFAAGNGPFKEAAGDFNGDGKPDLVYLNGSTTPQASVLPDTTAAGAGTVSFATVQSVPTGHQPDYALVGDVNGDGKPDLVVTNGSDKSVSVLLNTTPTGSATVSFAAQQTFAVGTLPASVAAADFDADGRPDLAVTNANDNTVSVLVNTTPTGGDTVSFAAQQTFAVGTNPAAVSAADFNGDGLPDLVVADANDNAVSVLLNTSPVAPTAHGQTVVIGQGQAKVLTLTGTAPNGDTLSFAIAAGSAHGTLSGLNAATGQVTYTPTGSYTGPDSFTFTVTDTTTNLSSAAATVSLSVAPSPVVVGQFGMTGVWQYNQASGAWSQLTGANATLLADDPSGDVVGEFPGYGVWQFTRAAGWRQIHPLDVTVLALNASGVVAAEFPGYGVGEYLPGSGWRLLTAASAALLAIDGQGDIAGEFRGYGLWEFRPAGGWKQLHPVDVSLLAMGASGDIAADFPGYGVGEYTPGSGWRLLNGTEASALAMDGAGDVVASFPGAGVGEFFPAGGGQLLTGASAARLGADAFGDILGEFAGYGVWQYEPIRGWFQVRTADASLLAVS